MPLLNLTVAWVAIGLQMLAVWRLAKRSHYFPAMMAFSFASLFVVWFGIQEWNLAWSIGAWVMMAFKFAMVAEACALVLCSLEQPRSALLSVVFFSVGAGIAAAAIDTQATTLYSVRFVGHAMFAAAALAVLPFARFIPHQQKFHVVLTGLYFSGMTLADFNSPRTLSPRYWTIHLVLATLQMGCWFGWLALFNDLPQSASDRVYHPSAKVSS